MYDSCMATRTITLELDAYEKLRAAKRGRESFSSVVRRCILPDGPKTGKALLDYLRARTAYLTEEELDDIEIIDRNDTPPVSPWAARQYIEQSMSLHGGKALG